MGKKYNSGCSDNILDNMDKILIDSDNLFCIKIFKQFDFLDNLFFNDYFYLTTTFIFIKM